MMYCKIFIIKNIKKCLVVSGNKCFNLRFKEVDFIDQQMIKKFFCFVVVLQYLFLVVGDYFVFIVSNFVEIYFL